MKTTSSKILAVVIFLTISSCKTYYISVDSIKEQLTGIDSTKLKSMMVKNPTGYRETYQANPIKTIKCKDIKSNVFELKNSPSIEMKITSGYRNKRTVFYFDRVLLIENSLIGVQSRISPFLIKQISLDSITKIEIQDGHKKYSYINQ